MQTYVRLVWVLTMLLAWGGVGWSAVEYQVVDLGVDATGNAIDDDGTVAGVYDPQNQGIDQATLFTPNGLQELGYLPGGLTSFAYGVKAGIVVGSSTAGPNLQTHAFRWDAQHGMLDLSSQGTLGVANAAEALNATLTTVGWATPTGHTIHPIVWTGTQATVLPDLGGGQGEAMAINSYGDIVGNAHTATHDLHAVLWAIEGGVMDLDLHPGRQSFARAINDQRVVVGYMLAPGNVWHAFQWDTSHGMVDLGTLPQAQHSFALGLNNAGVAVGYSQTVVPLPFGLDERAVRWKQGQLVELNTLIDAPGWTLTQATAINDQGQITGLARVDNGTPLGETHLYLLQPLVPPNSGAIRGLHAWGAWRSQRRWLGGHDRPR